MAVAVAALAVIAVVACATVKPMGCWCCEVPPMCVMVQRRWLPVAAIRVPRLM